MGEFSEIRCGDRVKIKTPHGAIVSGKAIMFNRKVGCWVLNMGGRHGTPGLASEDNLVEVIKAKTVNKAYAIMGGSA